MSHWMKVWEVSSFEDKKQCDQKLEYRVAQKVVLAVFTLKC